MTADYFTVRREMRRRAGICRSCKCARLPESVFCAEHLASNREKTRVYRAERRT